MKGKEHMIVGTTATTTMGIVFIVNKTIENPLLVVPLVIGGFIGSYMPDIDSHSSKAGRTFNKILMLLAFGIVFGYSCGMINTMDSIFILLNSRSDNITIFMIFCIITILGKLSPHRMFTHKWLGTVVFCVSVYWFGNYYLTLGFTMGYVLHIVCDRFSPSGKNLKFFEFKLPCKNSKNKFTIDW